MERNKINEIITQIEARSLCSEEFSQCASSLIPFLLLFPFFIIVLHFYFKNIKNRYIKKRL